MKKIDSGIEGLDKLLSGGFPEGRAYLVAGEPGTGKTILTLQFLIEGIKKGEKAVFVSIDEKPEHIIADMESLGWPVKEYLKDESLQIFDVTNYFRNSHANQETAIDPKQVIEDIVSFIRKSGAQRVGIDPIAPLVFVERHIPDISDYIRHLIFRLEEDGKWTTLLTSYVPVGSARVSQHGIEEFAASGIVLLRLNKIHNKNIRTIWVRKIRGTRIDLSEYSFEILPDRGIVLRQPI